MQDGPEMSYSTRKKGSAQNAENISKMHQRQHEGALTGQTWYMVKKIIMMTMTVMEYNHRKK